MIKWIRQLFCKHIDGMVVKKFLYSVRQEGRIYYKVYANKMRCVKCGRETWKESKYLPGNEPHD